MRKNYSVFMNRNTIAYVSAFNEVGKLVTDIYTTKGIYRVDIEPIKLIDKVFKNYGSSYTGAKEGSKWILGDIDMPPLVIGGAEGLYLFPSESPSSPTCKWFFLHHIVHHKAIEKKKTAVYMTGELVLTADISKSSFESRLTHATLLKVRMEGQNLDYRTFDMSVNYQMVQEFKVDAYKVNRHS
ncbi:competence protein ComK [Sporosarcina luteola]|uniref:competence protein ComK n=1 Tax=Sporosarcina luteola TaxID=582850 RepID=UPI00203B9E50|nr:competence protein ComK [Sporosarcina luteola]MCM3636585.1 competence protein ComK [Sporosarcina luteola]